MKIEVVYALPEVQHSLVLDLPEETTAGEALRRSALVELYPEIAQCALGIWGRVAQLNDLLRDGDRMEIYRPLAADPKEARMRRVVRKQKRSG
ncbi:MAG: RnfH family protein [Betaproteobacteria bacterium]|nr:RnfH family protein [Betaproteobacteria bacterium]